MAAAVTYGEMERMEALGGMTVQHGSIAMDSSYPTGGEDVSGETWPDGHVIDVIFDPKGTNATYKLWWDKTADVVYANTRADGAEVANTTDLSAVIVPFWILKKK